MAITLFIPYPLPSWVMEGTTTLITLILLVVLLPPIPTGYFLSILLLLLTNINMTHRQSIRSSSTSPSFFNRRVQQTKKDELLKKISHSKQSQIEPHEIKHNPLLLQLVHFTNKRRAAGILFNFSFHHFI